MSRSLTSALLTRKKFFCYFHQVIVVGVGHVELACSELGIVGQVNAWSGVQHNVILQRNRCKLVTFIPELSANLVHSINSTHNQHLVKDTHSLGCSHPHCGELTPTRTAPEEEGTD